MTRRAQVFRHFNRNTTRFKVVEYNEINALMNGGKRILQLFPVSYLQAEYFQLMAKWITARQLTVAHNQNVAKVLVELGHADIGTLRCVEFKVKAEARTRAFIRRYPNFPAHEFDELSADREPQPRPTRG